MAQHQVDRPLGHQEEKFYSHVRLTCVVTLLLLCKLAMSDATAAPKKCAREEAQRAEAEASSLKTWAQIFGSYKRYRNCDDGAISEGYSASVAALLATGWDHIGELLQLIKSHPNFEQFVLRHIDDTMTRDQDEQIRINARDTCPTNAVQFCAAVQKRFAILDAG
jgi:hypothetical protein